MQCEVCSVEGMEGTPQRPASPPSVLAFGDQCTTFVGVIVLSNTGLPLEPTL
jgi:hypothetical protein